VVLEAAKDLASLGRAAAGQPRVESRTMAITEIDHIVVAAKDLSSASAPFERLGLTLTAPARHSTGNENRAFFAGDSAHEFYVELVAAYDASRAATAPGWEAQRAAAESGQGAFRIVLGASDLAGLRDRLSRAGARATIEGANREDGSKLCDILRPDVAARAGCHLSFITYPEPAAERRARHKAAGFFTHALPIKRLDHLALIAPNLDEITAFWTDVLGVPVAGEVRGRGMVIKQMRIGDGVVELIGPDSPESPLASRPAGLISMAAFEVADLAAAVAEVRSRGFTAADPAPGVLPNSATSTVSGDQLSGLSVQLIAFG
jgi:catechol 2,3-dioxygenase-like lactoylglutathione lyase family enzyme